MDIVTEKSLHVVSSTAPLCTCCIPTSPNFDEDEATVQSVLNKRLLDVSHLVPMLSLASVL